jgi:hypothetical protein
MSETKTEDISRRVANLEAWVEVVMRTLATLGLENLLTELDTRGSRATRLLMPYGSVSLGRRPEQ